MSEPLAPATLAFLFTDLEGSTRLWQQFPQAMQTVLARHDALLRAAVAKGNGWVVKTTGDGFHAAFASVQDGLAACIYAQQSLLAETWAETGPLRVRMGLHVGEAQQREGDYYGTTVNRAARLMAAAHGGQVLLSAAAATIAAGHLPDDVTLRDLGEHRLKDLQRPEHIFQLLCPGLPADFPPITSLNRVPNNLPSQPTRFVGREQALQDIHTLLISDTVRLLTLTGPGGTGKTRLALQAGADLVDRFGDGAYFIDLAPLRDPQSVLAAIARTIGLSESSNGSMLRDLKEQLRDRRMLLLLDNFEQVTSAAVPVVELLQACPRLKLLTTSREALRVRGEHLYPVPPLGLPALDARKATPEDLVASEAVQLFVARAQAVRPDFELTAENAAAVAALCQRLDGLPLALELAAARVRLFSPQVLIQRLGSRFKLLRGGARDLPARQQTLWDTIDWSYELLDPGEKILLAVVSVFAGGTFAAVEAVAGASERLGASDLDIVEGLVSLVDKSLIRLSDDGAGEPRLQMLETIREYAAGRLAADADTHDTTCRAHATYFAALTVAQASPLTGREREAAIATLTADVENLKIAWRYWVAARDLVYLQQMVNGLWLLYESRGWYQAMVELTTDLLNVLADAPSTPEQVAQEITLRTSLARALLAIKGYTPEVEEAYTQALALSERHGELPQLFPVLRGLSSYYMYRVEFDKGVHVGKKILELAARNDDDQMRVAGYLVLGANTGFLGDMRQGLAILDKGIALFDPEKQRAQRFQLGNIPGIVCFTASAIFSWWLGYPDEARRRSDRAVALATKLNHPFTLTYTLFHAGLLHMWRQELADAARCATAMAAVAAEYEYQLWRSLATILRGAVESARGQTEEGLVLVENGIASYLGHKSPPVFWPQLTAIRAETYARAGRAGEGLRLIDDLLAQDRDGTILNQLPELGLLQGGLLLAASPDNRVRAATLFRQMRDQAEQNDAKMLALQAAIRLCRLEGGAAEDYRALAVIYDRFNEGWETAALVEAKRLLETWRG